MQNLRVKYYREEDWISEMKLAQGMSEEFYKECFQLHCYVQQYDIGQNAVTFIKYS